jgi:acylphosphatase
MMKKVRAIVTGRVQGVWYRASTMEKAQALGLKGYVRNLPDGNVEFVARGEEQKVDELIAWARQGPPSARVEQVEVDVLEDDGEFSEFSVRY